MADIYHDFRIKAPMEAVFDAVSTPEGLDRWWTKRSSGNRKEGAVCGLWFGPGYEWRGKVTKSVSPFEFELEIFEADQDWDHTRVGFHLEDRNGMTQVQFYHVGWPENNEHYRVSSFCWAMYLRILRRYVEYGESVAYEKRLDA